MKRTATVAFAVAVLVTAAALPALADPAQPTNYQSVVEGLDPHVPGVQARVQGGDSFLQVTASEGTAVEVPGYEGEPYVRIDPDGVVSINRNSPAYWLNNDRFAQVPVPPNATKASPPDWQRVASDGTWAWHDHRIHWMAPDLPPTLGVGGPQEVFEWTVPIRVDGETVTILGRLTWLPSLSPAPWLLLGVALTLIIAFVGRDNPRLVSLVTVGGAVSALAVSLSQQTSAPPGAGAEVVPVTAAVMALIGAVASAVLRVSRPTIAEQVQVVSAILLVVWGAQHFQALWLPALPTPLPPVLERALTTIASATGLGALLSILARHIRPLRSD